jgi:methionyl-tRNA formyltransferase
MKVKFNEILYVYYRSWASKAYNELFLEIPFVNREEDLHTFLERNSQIKHIIFVGWSSILKKEILENYSCYCIHPSKLPLFRGGSPIQNQIIDGLVDSAVTLFKMTTKLDAGPIISQKYLSLTGSLDDIFNRIAYITADQLREFIMKLVNNEPIQFCDQDEALATFYKRRKPEQSLITLEELAECSSTYLYNKIRALNDPYPNSYIICADGKKLFIKNAYLE